MAIDYIFTKEKQIDIIWKIKRIKDDFNIQKVHGNRRFYFSKMADDYGIVEPLLDQAKKYEQKVIGKEELTTNQEIADLFDVSVNTVESYLCRRINTEIKAYRGAFCLARGRTNGWEHLKNSGKIHILTKEDMCKPKKNGNKTANFNGKNRWSYKNS